MPDVEVIHAFSGETGRDLSSIFLQLKYNGQKTFDVGGGYIVAVRSLDERLALEVEDGDE